MAHHPLLIVYFGCGFLLGGVVLDIISLASREWMTSPDGSRSGLWAMCTPVGACVLKQHSAKLDVVRAMMVLSVLVSGIVLIVAASIALVCRKRPLKEWIVRVVTCFTFVAVVLALVGILVYHINIWMEADKQVPRLSHGYSFWLGVDAIVLFFIAGICFLTSDIVLCLTMNKKQEIEKHTPVAFFNPKSVTSSKDVYFSDIQFSHFETEQPEYMRQPSNDNAMYYNTRHLPPGIHTSRNNMKINPRSHAISHSSMSLHPPRVWVA